MKVYHSFSALGYFTKYLFSEPFKLPDNPMGITHTHNLKGEEIIILKSVDHTYFYKDNLDQHPVHYTCKGQRGDQNINEYPNNMFLLNENIKHIYLYRKAKGKGIYTWYGEVKIRDFHEDSHIDVDYKIRKIYTTELSLIMPNYNVIKDKDGTTRNEIVKKKNETQAIMIG
jgi:hypothetical protein